MYSLDFLKQNFGFFFDNVSDLYSTRVGLMQETLSGKIRLGILA